jgi:hypothetical protein
MTTIVGFEGSIVPNAAGILPVVAVAGEAFEVIRCTPRVERVAISKGELERAIERGLLHRLDRELQTSSVAPVLLYLPERLQLGREHFFWMDLKPLPPGVEPAFSEDSNFAVLTSHTRAHDLLRLLLEEMLGALRLGAPRWRWPEGGEAQLFLRSASAVLKDENLRERVFAVLFAQVADDEKRWDALFRDAQREFSAESLERIKLDAEALRPPRELSANAG